jgi:hypothetical protein
MAACAARGVFLGNATEEPHTPEEKTRRCAAASPAAREKLC